MFNAAVSAVVFTPPDVNVATPLHDVNEGASVTATSNATGAGELQYDWALKQGTTTVAAGTDPSFTFVAPNDGSYSVELTVTDDTASVANISAPINVLNEDPTITSLSIMSPINENAKATLTGTYGDPGLSDTHELDIDWDGDKNFDQTVTVSGGTFSISHPYLDDAPTATASDTFFVHVTLRDDDGGSDNSKAEITVDNVRPVLVVANNQTVNEGQLLDLSIIGAPPLGLFIDDGTLDSHTATVDWGDGTPIEQPTIFSASGSGALAGTHTYNDDGIYTVTVTVTDDDGGSDMQSFMVTVKNVAPTATLGNSGPLDEGSAGSVTFTGQFDPSSTDTAAGFHYAYDFDNDGMFDAGDGTYAGSGTNASQALAASLFDDGPAIRTVRARILDKNGGFTDYTTNVSVVNVAPQLVNLIGDTINEGGTATIAMHVSDPSQADVFEVDVNWQDGASSTVAGLGAASASGTVGSTSYEWTAATRTLKLSHQYLDDNPSATPTDTYHVALTVRDDDSDSTGPTTVDVTVNNRPPVLVVANNQIVDEGELLDLSIIGAPPLGLFIDDGINDTHVATVDWGDGSAIENSTIFFASGSGALAGTHTYVDNGTYTVTVTVTDDDGGSDSKNFKVTVNNVAPQLTNLVGDTINEGQTATITTQIVDPSPVDVFEIDVNWQDGATDMITNLGATNSSGAVGGTSYEWTAATRTLKLSHVYLDDNPTSTPSDTYHVALTVRDDDAGSTGPYSVDVVVDNVRPVLVVANNQTVNEGQLLDLSIIGAPPLGLFIDDGVNDTHMATVNWGDGSTVENPTIFFASGSGALAATHTYADDGIYTVTVTVTDDDGGTDIQSFTVTVGNVAPTLVVAGNQAIDEGALLNLALLGSFTDPGFDNPLNPAGPSSESFTFDVDWGDGRNAIVGLSVADMNGSPGNPSKGSFGGSHTYADNGLYTVTVKIRDDNGGSDTETFMVTVANVKPTIAVVANQILDEGSHLSLPNIGTFTDPGFDNPLNVGNIANGGETQETFTFSINWGDGTSASTGNATVDTPGNVGVLTAGSFDGSHTFADNGTYTVTVTVFDDDGDSDVKSFLVTVNNVDPTLTGIASLSVDEGEAFTLDQLGVGLSDPGFDNPLNAGNVISGGESQETFTGLTINWGDGTATTPVSIVNRASGMPGTPTTADFDHTAHTYADNGIYTVTITVQDDDGPVVARTLTITVDNVVPTLVVVPNQVASESGLLVLPNIGTLSDPGFDNPLNAGNATNGGETQETFTFTINWGDGTTSSAGAATIDTPGAVGLLTMGSFDGSHVFADNGTYTVTVTVADDDGGSRVQTFTVTVANIAPALNPFANGKKLQGDDIDRFGVTKIRGSLHDPGYDNPLNTLDATNGGETYETVTYLVDWGDGTVDAMHHYTTPGSYTVTITTNGGLPVSFTNFAGDVHSVLTLVSSQQGLYDASIAATPFTYLVNWGDGTTYTLQLMLKSPGGPTLSNGQTTVLLGQRTSGDANVETTAAFEIEHKYLGPPNPLNPTNDVPVRLTVIDDDAGLDGGANDPNALVLLRNPGIGDTPVAIDTTPDVPRLDLTPPPMVEVFVGAQGSSAQVLQTNVVRASAGDMSATAERFLQLHVVYPDGTEGPGYRIKDEALDDLRGFFKTLPDGKYRVYLVSTENNSKRLVIEVDVRQGRVIDTSDDSEGTRDRPPTSEEQSQPAQPLEEHPLLDAPTSSDTKNVEPPTALAKDTVAEDQEIGRLGDKETEQLSSSPDLLVSRSPFLAFTTAPWFARVDKALTEADEITARRLQRAGKFGRFQRRPARSRPTT